MTVRNKDLDQTNQAQKKAPSKTSKTKKEAPAQKKAKPSSSKKNQP